MYYMKEVGIEKDPDWYTEKMLAEMGGRLISNKRKIAAKILIESEHI